jgi:hypothetical protein
MKQHLMMLSAAILSTGLLSACTNRDAATNPSLSPQSAPTRIVPAPSNYRANALMQGSQMTAPTRP